MIKSISETDYFKKSLHFQVWLIEEKKKMLNDLDGPQQKSYFKKFVKQWNRGRLDDRFYQKDGIRPEDLPTKRTSYNWNLSNEETIGPVLPESYDRNLRDRDRDGYRDRDRDGNNNEEDIRIQRKLFRKQIQNDNDELVPKPSTPHEARREKRAVQSNFRKERENDDALDTINEYEDPESFRATLKRVNGPREQKAKEQMERAKSKVAAYKAREEKALEKLKEMARARGYEVD
eukprot:TRINITY_DN158_c0_g1_i16.p1 TRINITY_DN158_c0_g1~~TRINITY_DN158_c0_g1_i16.p1  ORF type:complete len:233 (+),score=66.98 TRINITY_DN158_c0_g1_i16:128-826(+)